MIKTYQPPTWREWATVRWEGNIQDYRDGWAAHRMGKERPLRIMGKHYRAGWRARRNFVTSQVSVDKVAA
jgi:hypothetical protein